MYTRIVGVVIALALAFVSLGTPAASAHSGSAVTTSRVNMRSGPSTSYSIKRSLSSGTSIYVVSGLHNGDWLRIKYDGSYGYVHQNFVRIGGSSGGSGGGTTSGASSKGSAIAATAKQYIGYPYVWGGTSPSGFDCSGLTQYVYGRNGISIPRSTNTQAYSGYAVSQSNLQPGDLLIFQNTYKPGISHAGIYVGNGYMVHASNPSTGVKLSYLWSGSYYRDHWWGARRIR